MTVIYIAGYGRSGSTALELLVAQSPSVISLGELVQVDRYGSNAAVCTCGKPVVDCNHYKNLSDLEKPVFTNKFSYLFLSILYFLNIRSELSGSVSKAVDGLPEGKALLDSSKSTFYSLFRPFEYRKKGRKVYIIYNKRRTKDTLASLLRGSNRDLEKGMSFPDKIKTYLLLPFRVINFFFFGRASLYVYKIFFGSNVIEVKYEEWVDDPNEMIYAIGRATNISTEKIENAYGENRLYVGHAVAGNRMRANKYGQYVTLGKR
ncbi:hypothetical protein ACLD02_08775 [Alloalcanivorax sp. C16-2]|uniref:hypothetical protein n=1 Tax=Alloalcanivorax sp. C16-2 TaxID=3390052 RepID=UPI003970B406